MFVPVPSESGVRRFKPETVEVQYTIRLSDWWKDISAATVSFGDEPSISAKSGRLHQLLSDVGEFGYFDCTVEVGERRFRLRDLGWLICVSCRSCTGTRVVTLPTLSLSPTTHIIRVLLLFKAHGVLLNSLKSQYKSSYGTRRLLPAPPCRWESTTLSAICGSSGVVAVTWRVACKRPTKSRSWTRMSWKVNRT